jgi:hypothetical protein
MKRILFVIVLIAGAINPLMPVANASGCPTGILSSLYPNECLFEYSDEAKVMTGTTLKLQPTLDSCDDTFSGIKLSTGYDRISYVRIPSVSLSGEMKPNVVHKVEVSIAESCRAWPKSYVASAALTFANGISVPISLIETNLRYREKFSGSIDSYCFTNTCATATLEGSFKLPTTASGSATLSLAIEYNSSSATAIQLKPITDKYNYSGVLFAGANTATVSPAPVQEIPKSTIKDGIDQSIPLTNLSFVADSDGILSCSVNDFTEDAKNTYSIIGTHWRISSKSNNKTVILDEYDWGLGVESNGDMIREYTDNGGKISLLIQGTIVYSYAIKNQSKGMGYECSVAIRTKSGIGRYASSIEFSKVATSNFVALKAKSPTTITCVKGKITKKVTGSSPKCPSGFKRK